MEESRVTKNFNIICKGFMAIGIVIFAVGMKLKKENENINKNVKEND